MGNVTTHPISDEWYTSPDTKDTIRQYFCEYFNIPRSEVNESFHKGGNYAANLGGVIIDNPPFGSIKALADELCGKGQPFVIYCPSKGALMRHGDFGALYMGETFNYYCGDKTKQVSTSFYTNLIPAMNIRILGDLRRKFSPITTRKTPYPQAHVMSQALTFARLSWISGRTDKAIDFGKISYITDGAKYNIYGDIYRIEDYNKIPWEFILSHD